ncbi:10674_t:CDS:1, partial [Funneliformis geosporum]
MTQNMPTEILGKINPEKVSNIQSITPDAKIDYMLKIDLKILMH